ncbi:hypothetical protein L9F63_009719, partial [Diploptera punctata]
LMKVLVQQKEGQRIEAMCFLQKTQRCYVVLLFQDYFCLSFFVFYTFLSFYIQKRKETPIE